MSALLWTLYRVLFFLWLSLAHCSTHTWDTSAPSGRSLSHTPRAEATGSGEATSPASKLWPPPADYYSAALDRVMCRGVMSPFSFSVHYYVCITWVLQSSSLSWATLQCVSLIMAISKLSSRMYETTEKAQCTTWTIGGVMMVCSTGRSMRPTLSSNWEKRVMGKERYAGMASGSWVMYTIHRAEIQNSRKSQDQKSGKYYL